MRVRGLLLGNSLVCDLRFLAQGLLGFLQLFLGLLAGGDILQRADMFDRLATLIEDHFADLDEVAQFLKSGRVDVALTYDMYLDNDLRYEPLIEAVMVGFSDLKSISFTSPGRVIAERKPEPAAD